MSPERNKFDFHTVAEFERSFFVHSVRLSLHVHDVLWPDRCTSGIINTDLTDETIFSLTARTCCQEADYSLGPMSGKDAWRREERVQCASIKTKVLSEGTQRLWLSEIVVVGVVFSSSPELLLSLSFA